MNHASIHSKQSGQSMVEFLVAAATVLVPLFMIIPIIGKYADINMTAPQAARYMAWERTVWHDADERLSNGIDENVVHKFPKKSAFQLRQEVPVRFLSHAYATMDSVPNTVLDQDDINPLWKGNAEDLVSLNRVSVNPPDMSDTPTWLQVGGIGMYDIMEFFNDGINLLYKPFSWLGGTANFTPNYDGYYAGSSDAISIPIENPDYLISKIFNQEQYIAAEANQNLETINIAFSANSGLLVDTWSVQGSDHFRDQTAGLVPMGLLRGGFFDDLFKIASTVLFEPNLYPGEDGLDLGGFNTDPFKLDYSKKSSQFCDKSGFCSFKNEVKKKKTTKKK